MGYQTPNLQTSSSGDTGTGPSQMDDSGTGMRPEQEFGGNRDASSNQGEQQQQQPVQQPYGWGQPPFNQQWNWNLPRFGIQFQFPRTRIGQVYLRMTAGMSIHQSRIQILCGYIAGYETFIAPFWRRCAAELIDTLLFSFLLKLYQPDIDLR